MGVTEDGSGQSGLEWPKDERHPQLLLIEMAMPSDTYKNTVFSVNID